MHNYVPHIQKKFTVESPYVCENGITNLFSSGISISWLGQASTLYALIEMYYNPH